VHVAVAADHNTRDEVARDAGHEDQAVHDAQSYRCETAPVPLAQEHRQVQVVHSSTANTGTAITPGTLDPGTSALCCQAFIPEMWKRYWMIIVESLSTS